MAFNVAQAGRRAVELLGRKAWLRKPFFWAGFVSLRLVYPVQFLLLRELIDCESVLDLGCGRHSMVPILPKTIRTVGVEAFEPHYLEAKQKARHTELKLADITKVDFPDKSFDAAILLDVVEHLPKEEGLKLLEKMERWARKKVVVFTPNGFLHQDEFDDNPLMEHLSGWEAREFKERGYKVYGVRGFRSARDHDHGHDDHVPSAIDRVADLAQVWTYHFPEQAFQLFCVKELEK